MRVNWVILAVSLGLTQPSLILLRIDLPCRISHLRHAVSCTCTHLQNSTFINPTFLVESKDGSGTLHRPWRH